jgi:cytochrome c-type biogenesis protein CcmE
MKTSYIVTLIFLAVISGFLITLISEPSRYANFSEAFDSPGTEFTVIGNLNRSKKIDYNPKLNPNIVTFSMVDKEGSEHTVVLNQSKPQDMERSEDIVVKGKGVDGVFYAHTILLKCPSKYEEKNTMTSYQVK